MKMKLLILALAVLTIYLPFSGCSDDKTTNPEDSILLTQNNDYIVVLADNGKNTIQSAGSVSAIATELLRIYNIPKENLNVVWENAIRGFSVKLTGEQMRNLQKDSRIGYIEQDRIVQFVNPVVEENQKGSYIQAQTTSWGLTAVRGYVDCSSLTSRVAWIIDTGIDIDHSDLNVDGTRSRTFVSSGRDSRSADDGNGHGSHVAGIVAAKYNTIGSIGVAAGAKVIAIKVLNSTGSGTYTDVISGVDHVTANAGTLDVANLSLGGPTSTALDDAIEGLALVCKVCLAAGNSSADAGNYSPSRVNVTNVYTVASFANGSTYYPWSSFSNYGSVVDCIEPGSSIYSTYKSNKYATLSGTSMATPFLTGILLANGGTLYTNALKTVSGVPTGTTTTVYTAR